jgi:cytochrome P450 family 130
VTGPTGFERFDPHDPTFQADPYPTYAQLRAELPVGRFAPRGEAFYWLTRYDDVWLRGLGALPVAG